MPTGELASEKEFGEVMRHVVSHRESYTPREYFEELARALARPLKFHGGALWKMQTVELAKWAIKRAGGKTVSLPSTRDLRSRGLRARFDTAETERLLNWRPNTNRADFVTRGIQASASTYRLE